MNTDLLRQLYRKYQNEIYLYLYSLSHNRELAQDLMQETFLQAYLSLGRYDGTCKESVWLCQIAKHLWYRHLAKHKKWEYYSLQSYCARRYSIFVQCLWCGLPETSFLKR